ncbi:hypothetical protein Tdes44962_MAKER05408 [Teratosphaeria destructans]|uniref:Uncharacterized protein n=1 Tax=Teratosphaeria destructans TaxID=418781 RepID=A0A9W7SJZ4_9PEZI|nr:hypothetical protein Tdes44962_MAKER05408 [Teratosphaeria destructans]
MPVAPYTIHPSPIHRVFYRSGSNGGLPTLLVVQPGDEGQQHTQEQQHYSAPRPWNHQDPAAPQPTPPPRRSSPRQRCKL